MSYSKFKYAGMDVIVEESGGQFYANFDIEPPLDMDDTEGWWLFELEGIGVTRDDAYDDLIYWYENDKRTA